MEQGIVKPESTLRIELPILLPEVEDERDQCVDRLRERVTAFKGIERAHIHRADGKISLCLHYDPNLLPLERVQRIAEQAGAQISNRYRHQTMRVTDMDCADCALSIEHILSRQPGIINLSANYAAERIWVEYDTQHLDGSALVERIGALGYHVKEERAPKTWLDENWQLLVSGLCGLFLGLAFFGKVWLKLPGPVAVALYLTSYVAGGYDASRHAFHAARNLRFDIDFLMIVAAAGAAILGRWAEGGLLLFLFSLGHALEVYAIGRARRSIEALGEITPRTARVRREGREREVAVEDLVRGDLVVVRPGERIPIDGNVVEGRSGVDQSAITGESIPVEKGEGDGVFAGSVNGGNSLVIAVTKLAEDTTLARVIRMVEEAQAQKSPTQRFADRMSLYFVPAVLLSAVLVMTLPAAMGWLPWKEAALRGITLLVAASPCALAIATPAAVLSGIAQAAHNGVLIKGGVHLENLGSIRAIAFDKTGTITQGRPEVTDLLPVDGVSELQLLEIAAGAESHSRHPISGAIVRAAQSKGLQSLPDAQEMESIPGRGVRAHLGHEIVQVGSARMFRERRGAGIPAELEMQASALERAGKTAILVLAGQRFLGIIAVADRPRGEVRAVLEELRALGIKHLIMLTGDNELVAEGVASAVGLMDYRAGLLPEDKLQAIRALIEEHGKVAMIGDGVNDAPALARSTVGIAMGASGSDMALESADVALMGDELQKLPFAVGLGRQFGRIIRQNLFTSMGVIALLVPAAISGLAGISLAIVLHEGSTLAVVFNALRLLTYGRREEAPRSRISVG
jgi:Cd2+/Zn2+-exporting ATPase